MIVVDAVTADDDNGDVAVVVRVVVVDVGVGVVA